MNILDTDILSLLLRKHPKVVERFDKAGDVCVSVISIIEVLRGRADSVFKAEDGEKILIAQTRLTNSIDQLNCIQTIFLNESSAAIFDVLRFDKKLKKIGRGDLLNACIALASKATLVTRNIRDYQLVPNLRIENWAD